MMRKLNRVSWTMALAGLALCGIALTLDLAPVLTLTGILLAWAGIVKIVVVRLWTHVAGLGTDHHRPIPPI